MRKSLLNSIRKKGSLSLKLSMISLLLFFLISCKDNPSSSNTTTQTQVQFLYTSDPHYGITRPSFQGSSTVTGHAVNAAMIAKMNTISDLTLPADGGVNAGNKVGGIDFIAQTGDIGNRMETSAGVQSAATSWSEFAFDYTYGLTLKDNNDQKSKLFLSAGNHDVSNAIGYYKTMSPLTDATPMAEMYNMMLNPTTPKTAATYNYATDKIHYSKDIAGVHFVFISIWPDSSERVWLNANLSTVSSTTPVILFAHDEPPIESKHFTNPNGTHDINSTNKFENIVPEVFKDGTATSDPSTIEQRAFTTFLKAHTNIKVYFNGNAHENLMYDWAGPDNDITLHVFQVDSPMKGVVSGTSASDKIGDETKVSFQLVTIDIPSKKVTVRECLWNPTPANPSTPITWGMSRTVSIQ
ncbi:MAG: hypothetical protein HGB19_00320 [Chlorobiales bacterium]|nr:hypothetical protein [Chlorobiales bacterium]